MTKIAMCSCGEPLVSTIVFRKFEFYCISCGRMYGYFEPQGVEETPERLDRLHSVETEWKRLSMNLIGDGAHYKACAACLNEPHSRHATTDEWIADEASRKALEDRITVKT
jgi:hypothetical protein